MPPASPSGEWVGLSVRHWGGAEPGWRSGHGPRGHAQQTRRWSERQACRSRPGAQGLCSLAVPWFVEAPGLPYSQERREDVSGRWLPVLQAQGWPGERKGVEVDCGVAVGVGPGLTDGGSLGREAADFQATEATASFHLRHMGESGQLLPQDDLGGRPGLGSQV